MPTTDELLEQMEAEVLSTSAENRFIVDNNLRTITVPGSITVLGVEHDDDVHRLYFQMPKMYGEFDLSEFDIRINYVNAADKPDTYPVDDKEVSDDNITFSWLVGRTAFEKMGDVVFNICLRKTDGDGIVIKEFNTTVATLPPVLEGLETTELIVQQNPDVIESILQRLGVLEENSGGGGTVDPEQIKQAVNGYLEENPPSGMTAEEKAQLQKNTEDISQLSEEIASKTGIGLSTEAIDKLEEVGNYLTYTTADGGSKWTELIAILRNGSSDEAVPATGITLDKTTLSFMDSSSQTLIATVEPSNSTDSVTWETSDAGIATVSRGVVSPVSNGSCTITAKAGSYSASCEVTVNVSEEIVTLQSISATYTGGDVPVGTSVTSLTGITVTATYSDGSMSNVIGYALSGEIVEGENTIMVSYEGKTTTFTVVGYVEEAETTEPVYRLAEATTFDGTNTVDTGYALCENYKAFTVVVDFTSTTKRGSVFGCDKNASYGVGVKCQSSYYWSAYWSISTNKDVHNASNGVKYVITHEANSNIAKAYYIYEDALTTQEFTIPEGNYNSNMNFTNTVILGSGFAGIINDFKIYESVLSQEEINAYVGV